MFRHIPIADVRRTYYFSDGLAPVERLADLVDEVFAKQGLDC